MPHDNEPLPSPSFDLFFDVKTHGQLKRKYQELKNAAESFEHLKEMLTEHNIGVNKKYTVWVGGTEVNDYYLNEEEAKNLAEQYREDGYDDVAIESLIDSFFYTI